MNNYLKELEAESIYIIREVAAEFSNPVVLYSIGKDSSVLLHLILKAFYPEKPPFKFLHIDTGWKFREMIEFRDRQMEKYGLDFIVYTNPRGDKENITPFTAGSQKYTEIMKTDALKHVLDKYKFDAAIGGARRDEEKSRAKERVFSLRNSFHAWDPKKQRAEFFNIFNGKVAQNESMRIFPLSNWTEKDIWQYIEEEDIDLVPLYFAQKRAVVNRDGQDIMIDDGRFVLEKGEEPEVKEVRFRTLGCYPLTAAVTSNARTVREIVSELELSKLSERSGRLIDKDQAASMERKKKTGYF